jgi:hypothetical protein
MSGVTAEGIRALEIRGADTRLSTVLKLAAAPKEGKTRK